MKVGGLVSEFSILFDSKFAVKLDEEVSVHFVSTWGISLN